MENCYALQGYTGLMFGLRFCFSSRIVFLLLIIALLFSAHTASAAEIDVGTTTAITVASEAFHPAQNVTSVPFVANDSKGKSWYIVDFYNFNGPGKKMYYFGRVIVNPETGTVITNTSDEGKYAYVTDDLNKLVGISQIADQATGEIGYAYTEDDARGIASEALFLTPDYSVYKSGLLEGDTKYYWVIDFVRYDSFAKKFYWGRRAIVDPYYGNVVTDPAIIQYFRARATDIPDGFDPLTKEQLGTTRSISTDFNSVTHSPYKLMFLGLLLAALVVLPRFLQSAKLHLPMKQLLDWTFGVAIVLELMFALYLYRYGEGYDATSAIWLFIGAIGTVTAWVSTRLSYAQGPKTDEENKYKFTQMGKGDIKIMGWSDLIVGETTLAELKRVVGLIENPDITLKLGIDPPKGILLYGPPGTGKTTIAKVLANEAHAAFFSISLAEIYSMWMGESEQRVHGLFQEARKHKPAIVFIDEIDSLMARRGNATTGAYADKIANQVLQEIDGIRDSNYVFVVGATNAPDAVDPALLRGGRLSTQIEIPLPEATEREKLFSLYLQRATLSKDIDVKALAQKTEVYSGADIKDICEQAIVRVYERTKNIKTSLAQKDLLDAIDGYARTSRVYHVPDFFKKRP